MGSLFSSSFDPVTDIPGLNDKVVMVTGGNTGIGYATIKHLARHGAKVYMAARNESKATAAIASLQAEGLGPGNGQVIWHPLDLSDPRSAKKSAEEFVKKETRLDVLINNAALLTGPAGTTDGLQNIMVVKHVHHVSPFVFTNRLLPLLKETAEQPGADVRIVNVSSKGHRFVSNGTRFESLEDLNREFAEARVPPFARYVLSKLANVLWTNELQKRLDQEGVPIIAISVHPGTVNTFADRVPRFTSVVKIIMRLFFKTWDQGSYNSLIAATSPVVCEQPEVYKGAYIEGDYGKVRKPSKDAQNPKSASDLWEVTEKFLKGIAVE